MRCHNQIDTRQSIAISLHPKWERQRLALRGLRPVISGEEHRGKGNRRIQAKDRRANAMISCLTLFAGLGPGQTWLKWKYLRHSPHSESRMHRSRRVRNKALSDARESNRFSATSCLPTSLLTWFMRHTQEPFQSSPKPARKCCLFSSETLQGILSGRLGV